MHAFQVLGHKMSNFGDTLLLLGLKAAFDEKTLFPKYILDFEAKMKQYHQTNLKEQQVADDLLFTLQVVINKTDSQMLRCKCVFPVCSNNSFGGTRYVITYCPSVIHEITCIIWHLCRFLILL